MKHEKIDCEEIKACRAAIRIQAHYGQKIYPREYYDYLIQCYTRILEAKKKQDLNFEDMKRLAISELNKIYRTNKNYYKKFTDLPDEEYEEGSKQRNVLQDETLENKFKYETLKECFIKFLNNYNDKQFIIDKLFNKIHVSKLSKKYNISNGEQTDIVYKFRQKFLNYLVKVGYFESKNNLKIEKYSRENILCKLCHQKKRNLLNYNQCPNDLKIYELIRDNIVNLEQYANDVFLTKEKLKVILNHNTASSKLYLYQINILRKKYFNNYTLEELAS